MKPPRYPVTINGEMLQAIFTRPKRSDTRPFLTRLLSSFKPVVRIGRKGLSFVGVRGSAEF
jgi:hypothetical protein